jgi:hypothetical protein
VLHPLASCPSWASGHHRVHIKSKSPSLSPLPPPISVSSTRATSPTLTGPRLTFPLLPQRYRRSPSPSRVTGGRRRHRSAATPPVSAASPMTYRYGEPPPSYSFPTHHTIDAHPRAAGVGEPPRPSHHYRCSSSCRRTCALPQWPVWATQANLAAGPGRTLASLGRF